MIINLGNTETVNSVQVLGYGSRDWLTCGPAGYVGAWVSERMDIEGWPVEV